MSTSVLNVWITNLGDPCSIANDLGGGIPYAWSVNVAGCGGLLNWSEGRYRHHKEDPWTGLPERQGPGGVVGHWYEDIPTLDGHVEIEVPPGTYVIRGSMHTWFVNGVLYGNWATDRAVVYACCGEDVCATLYASSFQPCSILIFEFVIPLLLRQGVLGKAKAEQVIRAMKTLHEPKEVSQFEQQELDTLRRAFANMEFGGQRRKRKR
jgi:hypothetical protein